MFGALDDFTYDLLVRTKGAGDDRRRSDSAPQHVRDTGQGAIRPSSERGLSARLLKDFLTEALPWVSRVSGEPTGMWVEDVGAIDNDLEPFPRGTLYAWIGVSSWEAAEAVYEAFVDIARIDEGRWIGGWFRSDRGFRKIKIYPTT